MAKESSNLKAVILVGGPSRGTRFRPLSLTTPKPLFPIAGVPMIKHHIEALARVDGMKEIFLVGFFETTEFTSFLDDIQEEIKIPVKYLREYQSLGTGGGLYHFRDQIMRGNTDAFFVIHADVVSSFPLSDMVSFHAQHKGKCTIMGTKVHRDDAHRYGCLVANQETREVMHYVEKPESFISELISCGVFFFSKTVFDDIKKVIESRPDDGEEVDADVVRIEQDILRPLANSKQLYVFETLEFWIQIKTASSAVTANSLYLHHYDLTNPDRLYSAKKAQAEGKSGPTDVISPTFIHPLATVDPTAKIGPNVSIGPHAVIGAGARIRDAVILNNVELKSNSLVAYSIVGWDCRVGHWARVEGTPQDPAAAGSAGNASGVVRRRPSSNLLNVTENGIKNQTATILGEDVTIKNEVAVRNSIVLPHKSISKSIHNEIIM